MPFYCQHVHHEYEEFYLRQENMRKRLYNTSLAIICKLFQQEKDGSSPFEVIQ